jgi:hypothetical protein
MGSGGFYTQHKTAHPLSVSLCRLFVGVCRSQGQLAQFALFISERTRGGPTGNGCVVSATCVLLGPPFDFISLCSLDAADRVLTPAGSW